MTTQRARPSSSGNARVWVKCAHRKYTVRRSKLASVKPCEVMPDDAIQTAIVAAATAFEQRLAAKREKYELVLSSKARLIPTVRKIREEMI